jgi:hypothetical protein
MRTSVRSAGAKRDLRRRWAPEGDGIGCLSRVCEYGRLKS